MVLVSVQVWALRARKGRSGSVRSCPAADVAEYNDQLSDGDAAAAAAAAVVADAAAGAVGARAGAGEGGDLEADVRRLSRVIGWLGHGGREELGEAQVLSDAKHPRAAATSSAAAAAAGYDAHRAPPQRRKPHCFALGLVPRGRGRCQPRARERCLQTVHLRTHPRLRLRECCPERLRPTVRIWVLNPQRAEFEGCAAAATRPWRQRPHSAARDRAVRVLRLRVASSRFLVWPKPLGGGGGDEGVYGNGLFGGIAPTPRANRSTVSASAASPATSLASAR